jgi:virulence-associated protein VapD
MATPKRFKSINFDLDTKRLEAVFGEGKRRLGYAQIQRFFTKHVFDHRQWSGYVSKERMTYAETYVVIDELLAKCPWLTGCANRFDVTDFMAESDAMEYILANDVGVQDLDEDLS